MPFFNSSAGKIYFEDTGQGSPIVFVHGRTLDCRMWNPQIDFFKNSNRCITYDLNGFGKSEVPSDGYDPVLTLKELFEQLNLTKASIIALSLGTHIVINFALEYPELVEKLILMSCTIPGAQFGEKFLSDWEAVESAGRNGEFEKAKELWIHCQAFSQIQKNNPKNFELFRKMVNDYTCWDLYNPPLKKSRPDAIDKLSKIGVPTLIMSGELDYVDFINNGKLLAKSLPRNMEVVIAGSSHMINLEFPEKINQLCSDYLQTS